MDGQPLKCATCGKECKGEFGLKIHAKTHSEAPTRTLEVLEVKPVAPTYNFSKYKELPPPIIQHLELTFGNWLKYMEVGQEWREDFGGYALYIKVPKEYSTEWKKTTVDTYDNTTFKRKEAKETEQPDIRWKSLLDLSEARSWINLVKDNLIKAAYRKGIRLPNTGTGADETRQTLSDYQKSIATPVTG